MKILELKAENFKRLSAVNIKPDGSVVILGGSNSAGKSSCLDAIQSALGGKKACPKQPIKRGAKKGEVVVKLSASEEVGHQGLIVTRTFLESGESILRIEGEDGYIAPSPQSILDDLCQRITFDPLAFSRMKPEKQVEELSKVVGLSFEEMNKEKAKAYEHRRQINAKLDAEVGVLERMPKVDDCEPVDEEPILAELKSLNEHQNKRAELVGLHERCDDKIKMLNERLAGLDAERESIVKFDQGVIDEIANLRKAMADLQAKLDLLLKKKSEMEAGDMLAKSVDKSRAEAEVQLRKCLEWSEANPLLDDESAAIVAVSDRLKAAQEANQSHQKAAGRSEQQKKVDELAKQSKSLTGQLEAVQAKKDQMLKEANWPIEGLTLDEEQVYYLGVPLEQTGMAELLMVSTAMGMAMSPELRIMLIRDGSLLDQNSLEAIAKMAETNDYQIWIERVGTADKCAVIISDGTVQGAKS